MSGNDAKWAEGWYDNGNKKLEFTCTSGRKNGSEPLWNESGQLVETMIWWDGLLVEEGLSSEPN